MSKNKINSSNNSDCLSLVENINCTETYVSTFKKLKFQIQIKLKLNGLSGLCKEMPKFSQANGTRRFCCTFSGQYADDDYKYLQISLFFFARLISKLFLNDQSSNNTRVFVQSRSSEQHLQWNKFDGSTTQLKDWRSICIKTNRSIARDAAYWSNDKPVDIKNDLFKE